MACGCGSKVCNCALIAGANVTITGAGSSGNPYVIAASGGGAIVTTTIAGLNALAMAAALVPGTHYKVTDWVSGTGSLPGPNILWVEADDASTPSKFVRVETPLGNVGPSDGEFLWNFTALNLMQRLRDSLGNDVRDFGSGVIDAFPWGHAAWAQNTLVDTVFVGGFTVTSAAAIAGVQFSYNSLLQSLLSTDLTGATGGSVNFNVSYGGFNPAGASGAVTIVGNQIEAGGTLTISPGGAATHCRVSAGATLDTGAFAATNVIVEGGLTVTLTAAETDTLRNANGSNQLGSVVPWSTLARPEVTASNVLTGNQNLRLNYFTATASGTSTGVRMYSGATPAAATPTRVQVGLYLIDAANGGTLIASTPNDTTLLAAAFTSYSKAWSVNPTLKIGQRYALGLLVVTAVAAPTMLGYSAFTVFQAENGTGPVLSSQLTGQATLPASFVVGSLAQSANSAYLVCA